METNRWLAVLVAAATFGCTAPTEERATSEATDSAISIPIPGIAYDGAPEPPPPAPPPPTVLHDAIARLADEATARVPGVIVSIAAYDFRSGEYAGLADDVKHVSASSAKAIWVAAALDLVGVAPVAPYATPIFGSSDNYASGLVIDLAGVEAINPFYAKAGMSSSGFTQWSFGRSRVAQNSPRAMGWDNYFTARDTVAFLSGVARGTLLASDANDALRAWMKLSPRSGYGGWLGTYIPEETRGEMMHKAGWLPPGCCDGYPGSDLNEIGLVFAEDWHPYAVSILLRGGTAWAAMTSFMEHASCVIFAAASGDATLDCR